MVYLCLFTQPDDRSSHWSVRLDDFSFVLRNGELSEQLQEEFPKHLIVINGLSWSIMVYWIYPGLSIIPFIMALIHGFIMVYHCFSMFVRGFQHGRRAGFVLFLSFNSWKQWTFPSMHLDMYIYIYWCIFWIDLSKIAYLDDFFLWSHDCHIDLLKVKWKKWRIAMEPWSHGGGGGFFPGSVRRVCSQTGTGARDSGQRTWMEGQAMAMGIPLN